MAKPNMAVISHIHEKFGESLSLKLGSINELSFSIPHFIEDEKTGKIIRNQHADDINEKMLIQVKMGAYKEFFVVDSIEEDGDDVDIFNVTAFSLGYELKGKRITNLVEESINPRALLEKILEVANGTWTIGEMDTIFDTPKLEDNMFRSFDSGDDSNALECINQFAETFGGLVVWDTINRKVSFKDVSKNGKFRGMTVKDGHLLGSINRNRTTDELVTRLHIYGSEDLTIHSVNPTGQGYLEDFSYFMKPFSRDANKNVIQSSRYMSDALCHAILDHKLILENNAPMIKTLSAEKATLTTKLILEQSNLDTLESELDTILKLLDTAKAVLAKLESEVPIPDVTAEKALVTQRESERRAKQTAISTKTTEINGIESQIDNIQTQLDVLQDDIANQSNFTPELLKELNLFVIDGVWKDDNYINADELYSDGVIKFAEIREPKVVIEVSIDNLLGVLEEQYYWDKLVLGDLIKIKYPKMDIEYMAKIIEINYDLEAGEASLVIANHKDLLNDNEKLIQLMNSNSSATNLIQNNKYKWDKINAVSQTVSTILSSEWDANKNKIIAGVNNSVEIGNRGVIIKNPDFPNEVIIIQSGIVALSQDGGETWKTAIKPDGIVAERLIGQIIAGNELLITNSSGSFTMDDNGAVFDVDAFTIRSGSGGNLVDRWQDNADFVDEYKDDNLITAYEKKMLKIKWEEIAKRYTANATKLQAYFADAGVSLEYVNVYHTKYDDLYKYLFVTPIGDKPLLADNNLANTTRILSSEFDGKFRAYDTALVELEKQLAIRAKELSDQAIEDAKDANDLVNEVMNDVVYKIELHSSNGWVFRNGQINTTVTAKVYRGKDDITSTIPISGFIWKKFNKDGVLDTSWNNLHLNVGKQITITKNDVYQKATFQCEINIV